MNTETENRHHQRIPLNWPVIFMTPQGSIFGETSNISVSGAHILCPQTIENDDEFKIFLTPHEYHHMPVTCEKAWESDFYTNAFSYIAMGVRFTEISSNDREIISLLIAESFSHPRKSMTIC